MTEMPFGSARPLKGVLLLGAGCSILLCYAIATSSWVVGSIEGGWTYNYVRPFALRQLLVAAGVSAAAALLLRAPIAGQRVWVMLVAWVMFASAAHGLMYSIAPYDLEQLFVSPAANSFYTLTQERDASDLLERFNRVRLQAPWHARSNMPGKTMLTYALTLVTERTDVLPWLVVLVSNLGALLMYAFVREAFDDRRSAFYSAVLYLFVPSRVFFFPLMNTVTPVVALACGCLLVRWIRTGSVVWAVLLGAALYGLVFFEPLPLVLGLLFAALAGLALHCRTISPDRFVLQSCAMLVAFIATVELVVVLSGFDLLRAFRQIHAHALEFNVVEARAYGLWVRANLWEFLFGVGMAQALLLIVAPVVGPVQARGWRARLFTPIAAVSIGLLAVLLVTDLLGVNRGEVIRLWIFLACFCQIPAAYACARFTGHGAIALVLGLTILQITLGTAMIRFIIP
ncbi:MAG TPA: hypothetical protein VNJ03_08005 [Vicinamibacterales bacterium]|nr:hypothetical protein [Vicinamibacterales bacterium]